MGDIYKAAKNCQIWLGTVEDVIKLKIFFLFFFGLFDTDCTRFFLDNCKSLTTMYPPGAGSLSSYRKASSMQM